MKRIFIILCLITFCNISYADIASVGYVDSVVATKQDSISDLTTIRSGAGLGATAVQPSSLSAVATSGSYNDLTNKPTIPNIPTGPNDRKEYNLIWNGKTGRFMFEEIPSLQCDVSAGMYDIGLNACVNSEISSDSYAYINHDGTSENATTLGLTAPGTWAVNFDYGRVSGIVACYDNKDICSPRDCYLKIEDQIQHNPENTHVCWCKMTYPMESKWVVLAYPDMAGLCITKCAMVCANGIASFMTEKRQTVYGTIEN